MIRASRALSGLLAASFFAFGQDSGAANWTWAAEASIVSQYLWRGFVLNDSPSFQPSLTVGYRGFSANSWLNFSRRVPGGRHWTEHDLTLDYSREIRRVTLSAGYINYYIRGTPPEGGSSSSEFYAGIAHSGLLKPSFRYYRDVDQGRGDYLFSSIGHTVKLPRSAALNLTLGLGLNHHLYVSQTAISDVDFGAALDLPAGSRLKLSPFFTGVTGHRTLFPRHYAFGLKVSAASK